MARPLPTTLRLAQDLGETEVEALERAGLELSPLEFTEHGRTVWGDADSGRLLEHRLGFYYLQEAASMIPPEVIRRLAPAARVIGDFCAAPGSKTTQLAASASADTVILANEPSGSRLKALAANLVRCRATNVVCSSMPGESIGAQLPEAFDAVLVDAPCSGEGTIRKDRQALRGWNRKRFKKITRTQRALLQSAVEAATPGGVVVYSTCALSPEENHDVVADVLSSNADCCTVVNLGPVMPELKRSLTDEGFLWVAPHHYDTGGFFVAAIRKAGEVSDSQRAETARAPDWTEPVAEFTQSRFGVDLSALPGTLRRQGSFVILSPPGAEILENAIRLNRSGIKIASIEEGTVVPHQEFALCFGSLFSRGTVEVERDEARQFLYGSALDLPAEHRERGILLVRWAGRPVGFTAWKGGRWRNLLGPAWVQQSVV